MKPKFIDRSTHLYKSINVEEHCYPHFLKVWHYHAEIELVSIVSSSGTRFIGDSIRKFQPDDLILIGEHVPHLWLNDHAYFRKSSTLEARALVVHFDRNFAGTDFFQIPEMKSVNDLLVRASYGIEFQGSIKTKIRQRLHKMLEMDNFQRVMELINILKSLSAADTCQPLCSPGFINAFGKGENKRMDIVYEYIIDNFKEEISLDKIASLTNMNKSSFCRYFRKVHNKTLTLYINEFRIGYACKLLLERQFNISEICFESGFKNISNFNRQFKEIMGLSPSGYRNKYAAIV